VSGQASGWKNKFQGWAGGTVSTAIAARQRAEGIQLVAYVFICLAKNRVLVPRSD